MQENILSLCDALLNAREAKSHVEEALKQASEAVDLIEAQLIEQMMTAELQNVKRTDGVQFSIVTKTNINAEPMRKDELWDAMKKQGFEHLFSINPQTLSGEIKRMKEENNGQLPTWLDGLVKQFDKTGIRIKK